MIKKALAAIALAGCATQAAAVSLALNPNEATQSGSRTGITDLTGATAVIHTVEGMTGETAMTAANLGIVLTANIVAGDKLTVTYTQPFATGATAANTLTVFMPGSGTGQAADTMTLSRDGGSAVAGLKAVTYTVADVEYQAGSSDGTSANTTIGAIIYTDSTLTFAPCTAACTLKVNGSVSRGDSVTDPAATTAVQVASAIVQYTAAATTTFNGIVDVAELRKKFTGAAITDQAVLALTSNAGTDGATMQTIGPVVASAPITNQEATKVGSTVKLSGSFGFLDLNATKDGVDLTATGLTSNVLGGDGAWVASTLINAGDITFTDADASQATITIDVTSNNKAVIPVQTLSSVWTRTYTSLPGANAGSKAITVATGSFTMNGSATSIYAVPYGPGIQQYLWVTNEGTAAGNITATAFDSKGTSYPTTGEYDLGAVAAKEHKAVAASLKTLLEADGLDTTVSQRLQIAMTVTVPTSNVNIYAAYRTGDARLALSTSASKDRAALNATAVAVIDTNVDDIETDTGTTIPGTITTIDNEVATLDGVADDAKAAALEGCTNAVYVAAGLRGIAAADGVENTPVAGFDAGSKMIIAAGVYGGSNAAGSAVLTLKDCLP
jgi:hypothetical protein